MFEVVKTIIALVALALAILGVWKMSQIGSQATLETIRKSEEEARERIRAHGEETQRQIARVHEEAMRRSN